MGVIDFSLYLRTSVCDLSSPENHSSESADMTKVLDQKNYIEELNRHLKYGFVVVVGAAAGAGSLLRVAESRHSGSGSVLRRGGVLSQHLSSGGLACPARVPSRYLLLGIFLKTFYTCYSSSSFTLFRQVRTALLVVVSAYTSRSIDRSKAEGNLGQFYLSIYIYLSVCLHTPKL